MGKQRPWDIIPNVWWWAISAIIYFSLSNNYQEDDPTFEQQILQREREINRAMEKWKTPATVAPYQGSQSGQRNRHTESLENRLDRMEEDLYDMDEDDIEMMMD